MARMKLMHAATYTNGMPTINVRDIYFVNCHSNSPLSPMP